MSDQSNDKNPLANQFLDLWQEQLTSMIHDPETVATMIRSMNQMQTLQQNYMNAAASTQSESQPNEEGAIDSANDSNTTSILTACYNELFKLHGRIAVLEERVNQLESELAKASKGTRSKTKTPEPA